MNTNRNRKVALRAALAVALASTLAACGGMATNRSLDSIHQPVVSRTNYTLDLTTSPSGLSIPEQRRLAGWFEAMDLRYGDRIAIDDPLANGATRAAVEAAASRFGLLVSAEAPVTQGYVNAGTARVVITRSSATVPNCPDWSTNTDANLNNGIASGYGCATNGNIAAMVANPEHLLEGEQGTGETTVMTSTRAIESYRNARPTGEGGLKSPSTQGQGGN